MFLLLNDIVQDTFHLLHTLDLSKVVRSEATIKPYPVVVHE